MRGFMAFSNGAACICACMLHVRRMYACTHICVVYVLHACRMYVSCMFHVCFMYVSCMFHVCCMYVAWMFRACPCRMPSMYFPAAGLHCQLRFCHSTKSRACRLLRSLSTTSLIYSMREPEHAAYMRCTCNYTRTYIHMRARARTHTHTQDRCL